MSESNQSTQLGGILAAFAIGALAGAGLALLYAPRSGRETRELLAQRGRDLSKIAGQAYDGAKHAVQGKRAEFAAAVGAGRQAMQEEHNRQQSQES